MLTDVTLVDLLVGVLHAAEAKTHQPQIAAAVAQLVDEVLIGAAQFHIGFEVFREELSRVLGGKVRDVVEVDAIGVVVEGAGLLIVRSHEFDYI